VNGPEDRIQIDPPLMPLPLEVAVGPLGLHDARVAKLVLDPPEVGPRLEHPGGVGVTYLPKLPSVAKRTRIVSATR